MGRGGKVNCKRNFKRVRSKDVGTDDSDEDYVLENEEIISDEDDSDDVGNSLDGYESDETFGGSVGGLQEEEDEKEVEEEEEEEEEKAKKVVKLQRKRGCKRKTRGKTLTKSNRVLSEEEEEEEDEEYVDDEEDEYIGEDDDGEGADDDEEFNPEANDFLDEDEDFMVKKKKHDADIGKRSLRKSYVSKGQRKRWTSIVSKKPSVLNGGSRRRLRKKEQFQLDDGDDDDNDNDDDDDFIDSSPVNRKKSKISSVLEARKRRRGYVADSDSDFVISGSSDYEYTISGEERGQVQEVTKLFGDLKNSLRSSSTKKIMEPVDRCQQKKNLGRKGKEKVKELKAEVGKQVCGICLSEEDKRRSRGKLNCCSHFFCFACIMEWSKVESRCPLCKQRFKTITKNGRSTSGVDLRNVIIEVPKRDQVYQPTEEEIRSYIDPYENVICTECHEGGDDGLMLLCDLCDSPAHTYCVGLGWQVPEGNWYCDGCRPVALGSSSTQAQDQITDQRSMGANTFDRPPPLANVGESSASMLESSSHLAFPLGLGNFSSPRFPMGDVQVASPISGAGAPTLSVRRQIHRHIQHLISVNRMSSMAGRIGGESASNMHSELLNSRMYQDRETAIRNSSVREAGMRQNVFMGERLLANNQSSTSSRDNGFSSLRPNQFRRPVVQDPNVTTANRPLNLTLWPELSWANNLPGNEQVQQCNGRSSMGSDGSLSFYGVRDENQYYALKEQLQSMVKSHLRSLSRDIELGHDTYKDIARSSTHTILAACGLEHRRSEVQKVPAPSMCNHFDRLTTEMSMMKNSCTSCFDSFVRDVVKRILNTRLPQWLSLGL